ncbi:hypothetical protein GGR32_001090, partial [Mesonia hippocampi]|nr:hypothetical protein [Mesonia hippocampi]
MNNYNSSPSLTGVTITANTANNSGGGMYSDSSTLNLTNVHISGNTASSGAGMYSNSSTLNLTKGEITGNIANNNGGGIYSNSSTFNLTNVHISGNTAENGGGIINWNNSSSNLTNASIIGNIATNVGGGLANDNSSLSLTNATIAGNTANQVSAMHSQNNSAATINNTLVWGNTNYNNSTYTTSYSLIEGDNNTNNGNIDATGLNETDIFTDPANADYNLKDGSPAINTGDNSLYTGDINNDTDLAGNPRLYDNIIDMGAFESQTPAIILTPDANNILYVNKNVTGGTQAGDSWANAIPELADALKWARTQQDADSSVFNTQALQIYVAKGTYKPLYNANDGNYTNDANRDNAFVMVKNVQLYGGFDPTNGVTNLSHTRDFSETTGSILSGDFNNDDVVTGSGASLSFSNNTENAHHILIAAGNLGNALLDGFSLIGGNADGTNPILVNGQDIYRSHGSGMYSKSSSPSLTHVTITKNNASHGGGIYNFDSSSPSLTNVVITKNKALNNGGGIRNNKNCSPSLINVNITENLADYGGGIYTENNSSPSLTNVTITINHATTNGNEIYNTSSLTINNSIVWGGIVNNNGNYTANHSLIQGNSNTANGNIDATGLSATDIFTDHANADYSLKDGSPATNTGSNSLYTGDINNDTDLAGNTRLFGSTIDIGAFESQHIIISPDANNILYVDKNVTGGTQTGDSWANAIPELADALKWARTEHDANNNWLQNDSLQIYIAKGTYLPLYNAADGQYTNNGNRDNAFVMVKNVQLYGGFDPTNGVTNLSHTRDFSETTGSILSGDFNNDDVVTGSGASLSFSNNTENAYHVLVSARNVGNALLDGFSLTGGNASGSNNITVNGQIIWRHYGGGMYNNYSSPSLTNVNIANNTAANAGGMYNTNYSSPSLTNVTIANNTANQGGGMYNGYYSSPSLTNVNIIKNNSTYRGGGIFNMSGNGTFTNTTIVGNSPNAIYAYGWTFWNNSIVWGSIDGSNYTAKHSLIQGNSSTANGNIDATGLSETDIFTDPANADYSLKYNSSAIDAGDNTAYTNAGGDLNNDTDLAGNTRLFGGTIDIGAYEYYGIKTYWTGSINTDWHTAGNWTSGLPSTTSNAVIDQVINQPLVAATNSAEAYSIVINPGASLSVLGELSFQTSLTNHGDLLFLSNANATGQLTELPEGASITGNPAEVQRYIPSGTRAFRFLSSAVNSTDNIHTNWQEGALNNTDNPTPGFGTHITGDAAGLNGFDATPSGNASLFDFDNATQTWSAITNTDVNTLTIGKAYRLYVRGDRSIDVTSNAATPTATTLRAKGSLHTGNFSLSNLSGTAGGFNFVGNPYQATVDMSQVAIQSTNIATNYYWVWDPNLNTEGAYTTVDLSNGSPLPTTSAANQYLQPGQAAFLATANNANASILFKEENKATSQSPTNVFNVYNPTNAMLDISLLHADNILADQTR